MIPVTKKIICIDPGHGGADPGAVSLTGHEESDQTLAIAKAIRAREDWLPEVKFVYTRMEDKRLGDTPLEDVTARVELANSAKADLFVSIHLNADNARQGRGIETFHFRNQATGWDSPEGKRLAQVIQKATVKNTGLIDRGVKTAAFYVIRHTNMPAVLVEAGFIGGLPAEAELVVRPGYHAQVATGILQGIADCLGLVLEPPANWDPQAEVDRLLADGIINTPRDHKQSVTWGEFATLKNRERDKECGCKCQQNS